MMFHTTTVVLLLVLALLYSPVPAEAGSKEQSIPIDSVRIVAYSFRTLFIVGQTTQSLLRMCEKSEHRGARYSHRCEEVLATDEALMAYLVHRIDSLVSRNDTLDAEYTGVDVRVVVLLYKGGTIDTVSFGAHTGFSPPGMIVNDTYYRMDRELLRILAGYVLQEREEILHYLDVSLPQIDKQLDEYYQQHPEEVDRR